MICQLWDNSEAIALGIPGNDDHLYFSWKGVVFFSATMKGDTMDCHVAAKRKGKLILREAISQFCQYCFSSFPWCRKISACVKIKSVKNLCLKCGFVPVGNIDNSEVFVKWAQ